jgi:hypothetical protein
MFWSKIWLFVRHAAAVAITVALQTRPARAPA